MEPDARKIPARIRSSQIVVVVNVLVGLGRMKSVEVVVGIHCKHIAGPLGHGPTGLADDEVDMLAEDEHRMAHDAEVDMLAEDGHRMARGAVAASNEACRESGNTLP